MKKLVSVLGLTMAVASSAMLFEIGMTQPVTAQAAVKTHKLTSLPKTFHGTWYLNGDASNGQRLKIKVTGKKFSISKYRKSLDRSSMSATSEQYFTPYKVSGAGTHKNTIYLLNGTGINTIRRTTIKGKAVLISYNEQQHGTGYMIYTKAKHDSRQRNIGGSNPFGMMVTSRKTAKENRAFYQKINPSVKKYFGKAVKKQYATGGTTGLFKGIHFNYYSAYGFWSHMAN
ncbi:hypothetical protein [Lactiplantibacillus daowaiensis]|uniref:Extracellular protein n=1 Tax=Lactiplantibacillus daowaiensis TaxID=2559918 RepID=A0ABW1RZE4_9LACO|nr:hypothetical protein [Lactiplantibacillus daowaiensis]